MSGTGKILLAFRYDDFSNRSPTGLEEKVIRVFRQLELALTVGVIPYTRAESGEPTPLGPEKTTLIRAPAASGAVEVALHGYSHESEGKDRWGRNTEFSGLPDTLQRKRLSRARAQLEEQIGVTIRTFIPPWNSYDRSTLDILAELGFRTISAGRVGDSDHRSELAFLPATATLAELRDVVVRGLAEEDDRHPIIVLFHEYDFVQKGRRLEPLSFEEFSDILQWVAHQDEVRVVTLNEMSWELLGLTASRYAQFTAYHNSPLRRFLPLGWRGAVGDDLSGYLPENVLRGLRLRRALRVIALFGPAVAVSGFLGFAMAHALRLGPTWSFQASQYLSVASLAALVALALRRRRNMYFKGALLLTMLLAAILAFWLGS